MGLIPSAGEPAREPAQAGPAGAPVERWRAFAAAGGIDIPAAELEKIAAILDRLGAATRRAIPADLGFAEPVLYFRVLGGPR